MPSRLIICRNCRSLFEPPEENTPFGDVYPDTWLCSWHPGSAEIVGNGGARNSYVDYFRWSCCGGGASGAVIGGRDYPARRSPGCTKGHHVEDVDLILNSSLQDELLALQQRLREAEAMETVQNSESRIFISYSHSDAKFVDVLAQRFDTDSIGYWRDEKDILIGDVIDKAISAGIQRNALFLMVLSPQSLRSKWVERELDEAAHEAIDGGKVLLPVLSGGLTQESVPARVRRIKCANFNEDFETTYAVLRRSIQAHLARSPKSAV